MSNKDIFLIIVFSLIPVLAIYLAPSRESVVIKAFEANKPIKCANPFGDGYYLVLKDDGWNMVKKDKEISFSYQIGIISVGIERCYYSKTNQIR